MGKMLLKKICRTLLNAFLAGMMISLGGIVYLATDNKILGAFLFSIGLLTILLYGYDLFTGKVGYLLENKTDFLVETIITWFGNLLGAYAMGGLVRLTRLNELETFKSTLLSIEATKFHDNYLSLLVMGFFCGICIYFAVNSYKKAEQPIARFLLVIMGVMVFVVCGFEHCVADMFYFSLINPFSGETIGRLLTITLGNTLGGLIIPTLRLLRGKLR